MAGELIAHGAQILAIDIEDLARYTLGLVKDPAAAARRAASPAVQRLSITQDRAASLELARQAAAVERGREVNRRFLGEGTPYTPQSVDFYSR